VCFRFVFTGDPQEAERSKVLETLREQLENKKYLAEQFFHPREIGFELCLKVGDRRRDQAAAWA
jgi:hypothetical protein